MLMVVLGISLLFGVIITSIIHFYDQKNAKTNDTDVQEERVDPELINILQHESQLLKQLISHHKQLLHIEEQCDRLRLKDPNSNLIIRYEEDASMLDPMSNSSPSSLKANQDREAYGADPN